MKHSENQSIQEELMSLRSPEKAAKLSRFFKTGKGQYGEGDKFLGIEGPMMKRIVASFADLPLEAVDELISSPWHEVRMCGLLILVGQMKETCKKAWTKHHTKAEAESARKRIFDFYLSHTEHINNWDLVDLTCPAIVGEYLIGKSHDTLYHLSESPLLWERRIAMVSTLAFIRLGELEDTFSLASHFLAQQENTAAPKMHDLMQKAIGWMLREAGKKDERALLQFLDTNASVMPRTMLRYSIERLTPAIRLRYMKGDIQ